MKEKCGFAVSGRSVSGTGEPEPVLRLFLCVNISVTVVLKSVYKSADIQIIGQGIESK